MAITKIKVENLTVFEEMEMEIDANVNVIIGENGTGKTQLLKVINMLLMPLAKGNEGVARQRMGVSFLKLVRGNLLDESGNWLSLNVEISMGDMFREYLITSEPDSTGTGAIWVEEIRGEGEIDKKITFIPAKDILTHSPGFLSMERQYKMPFDKTLVDILTKASGYELKEVSDLAKNILPRLEKEMDGIVVIENDEFFILKNDGRKISFSLEAEGMKKIGLLWKLLMTGSITEGSILLWDEPEANINPKLIPMLAEIILELGRNGVQIFLATHDYFLPKYIEVLATDEDHIIFHGLYPTDNGVKCHIAKKFSMLTKNDIMDEKIKLYRSEVEKVLG